SCDQKRDKCQGNKRVFREEACCNRGGYSRRVVGLERAGQCDGLAEENPVDERPTGDECECRCSDNCGDDQKVAARGTKEQHRCRGSGKEMKKVRGHAAGCAEDREEGQIRRFDTEWKV